MESLNWIVIESLLICWFSNSGDADDDPLNKIDAQLAFIFQIISIIDLIDLFCGLETFIYEILNNKDRFLFEFIKKWKQPKPISCFQCIISKFRVSIFPHFLQIFDIFVNLLFCHALVIHLIFHTRSWTAHPIIHLLLV